MNVIRVDCATYDDYLIERDKVLDNFIAMLNKDDSSFEEYISIHTFSYIRTHVNTDPNNKGTTASIIANTFPDDKRTYTTKLMWELADQEMPPIEKETTLIISPDTVHFYVFHRKGNVKIILTALSNLLQSVGLSNITISGNDILIGTHKVAGINGLVSEALAGEWMYITYHWEQSYQDLLTPEEQATKLITGIEDEVQFQVNRTNFENLLVAEIERLLPITDPIIAQH